MFTIISMLLVIRWILVPLSSSIITDSNSIYYNDYDHHWGLGWLTWKGPRLCTTRGARK